MATSKLTSVRAQARPGRLALALFVITSAACGETPAPPPPARWLADVATTSTVRSICGVPEEPALRAVLTALPPCSPELHTGFVVSRTSAGVLLVAAFGDANGATVVVARDGEVVDGLPAATPENDVELDALLLAGILSTARNLELATSSPALAAAAPPRVVPYLADVELGGSTTAGARHFVAVSWSHELDADGAPVATAARHDAVLTTDGIVDVTTARLYRDGADLHVAALEERPPLEPRPRPTPLCEDAQEREVRARAPGAPPCDGLVTAQYVAARTSRGELLVVTWTDRRAAAADGPVRWGSAVLDAGDVLERLRSTSVPATDEDAEAILSAVVLLAARTDVLWLDAASARAAERTATPAHGVEVGFERRRDGGWALTAVGVREGGGRRTHGIHRQTVTVYEARLDAAGTSALETWVLVAPPPLPTRTGSFLDP